MNTVSLVLFGALLIMAGASHHSELQASYVASSNLHSQGNKHFEPAVFGDSDLHHLILHNLGLLTTSNIPDSSKKVVDMFGESSFEKKTLLNYLFLINTSNDTNTQDFVPEDGASHHAVKFDVCSDNVTCIIDLIYNLRRGDSLANHFENSHGRPAHYGVHHYSSSKNASQLLKDFSFSSRSDAQGETVITEDRTGKTFVQKKNVKKCLNDIVKGIYAVDVKRAVVYHVENHTVGEPMESHFAGREELFHNFAEEMCAIVSLSTRFSRDTNTPSLVTLYINSIGKLDSSLEPGSFRDIIHNIWSMTYNKFRSNLLLKFREGEVAGQVVLVNENNTVAHTSQKAVRVIRMLDDNNNNTNNNNTDITLYSRQQIVYRVFGISFVIVLALILVAMSSIQVQKDTLVYSKFLTVDQRR